VKRLLIISLLLLRAALADGQGQGRLFTGRAYNMPFATFADTLEAGTGTRLFFRPEWTTDLRVTGSWENATPLSVVTLIISPRGLYCFEDPTGNIVITRGYAVRTDFSGGEGEKTVLTMADTSGTVAVNGLESEVIKFGNPAERLKEGMVLLSGFITNDALANQ
jgi:hypothetical protein